MSRPPRSVCAAIVAYDSGAKKLVLITVNYGTAQNIVYDLNSVTSLPDGEAAVTTTNTSGSRLLEASSVPLRGKRFTIRAAANSLYSTVLHGVAL